MGMHKSLKTKTQLAFTNMLEKVSHFFFFKKKREVSPFQLLRHTTREWGYRTLVRRQDGNVDAASEKYICDLCIRLST